MLFPLILAGFLIFSNREKMKNKFFFLAGLLTGLAFLFKVVAVFDFAAFFIFILFSDITLNFSKIKSKKYLFKILDKTGIFLLSFIIPIAITALYFYLVGAFSFFLKATFLNNVGYVSYGNKFIIPQGLSLIHISEPTR